MGGKLETLSGYHLSEANTRLQAARSAMMVFANDLAAIAPHYRATERGPITDAWRAAFDAFSLACKEYSEALGDALSQ